MLGWAPALLANTLEDDVGIHAELFDDGHEADAVPVLDAVGEETTGGEPRAIDDVDIHAELCKAPPPMPLPPPSHVPATPPPSPPPTPPGIADTPDVVDATAGPCAVD